MSFFFFFDFEDRVILKKGTKAQKLTKSKDTSKQQPSKNKIADCVQTKKNYRKYWFFFPPTYDRRASTLKCSWPSNVRVQPLIVL